MYNSYTAGLKKLHVRRRKQEIVKRTYLAKSVTTSIVSELPKHNYISYIANSINQSCTILKGHQSYSQFPLGSPIFNLYQSHNLTKRLYQLWSLHQSPLKSIDRMLKWIPYQHRRQVRNRLFCFFFGVSLFVFLNFSSKL